MKALIALSFAFFGSWGLAQHREQGAHVHGSGKLSIAFDQSNGKVEFRTPAAAIVGFEHAAKSAQDKKAVSEASAKFESEIRSLVQMHPRLNCVFKKDNIEVKAAKGGGHSDFVANFNVICLRSPLGTSLTVDFSLYPNMKDVDVTVLVGELQKTAEVKSKPVEIELKP